MYNKVRFVIEGTADYLTLDILLYGRSKQSVRIYWSYNPLEFQR